MRRFVSSEFTLLAKVTLSHQGGHFVGGCHVAAGDRRFSLPDSVDSRVVAKQLDRGLEGLEIFCREEDDEFAAIPSDMDSLVRPVDLVRNLRQAGLDL